MGKGTKVVSELQLVANRTNAKRSTGPRSDTGKARSSSNSIRHGVFARLAVITTGNAAEDPDEFAALLDSLRSELRPVGMREDLEVERIAVLYWRQVRLLRYESAAIVAHADACRAGQRRIDEHPRFAGAALQLAAMPRDLEVEHAKQNGRAPGVQPPAGMPEPADAYLIARYEGMLERGLKEAYHRLDRRRKHAQEDASLDLGYERLSHAKRVLSNRGFAEIQRQLDRRMARMCRRS